MENNNLENNIIIEDNKSDNQSNEKLDAKEKDAKSNKKSLLSFFTPKFVITIATIIVVILIIFNLFFNKGTSSRTVVTSMLQDQKVISELSTLIVPCGGIYEEKNDKGKEILDIAYSGTVEYGLDFSQINISTDEENKKIIVKIPSIYIKEVYIDPSSISLIPEGKYNKTTEYLQKCKDDLSSKFTNNSDEMYNLAKSTAVETLSSFLDPIVKNIGDGYDLMVE